MQKKLSEVVDGVGRECRDAQIVGARCTLSLGKVFEVDAGQVEEGIFVERCEFLLRL